MATSREDLSAALSQAFLPSEEEATETVTEATEAENTEQTEELIETEEAKTEESADTDEVEDEVEVEEPAETEEEETTEEVVDETPEEDTFTTLDPNTLPPEALPFYKSMLADYTRKTMETAPLRNTLTEHSEALTGFFEGQDLTPAQQASEVIAWALKVNSDPQAALEHYNQLGQALNAHGVLQTPAGEDTVDETDLSPAEIALQRVTQLESQIAAQQAAAQASTAQAAQQAAQDQEVRLVHEEWESVKNSPQFSSMGPGALDLVQKIWIAEGGPMVSVAQRVKSEIDAVAKAQAEDNQRAYIQRKKEKQTPIASGPGGIAAQQQPAKARTIEEANAITKDALTALLANG